MLLLLLPMATSLLHNSSQLLQSQHPIDALDNHQDERLPRDQPTNPVEQLAVQDMRPLPRIRKDVLQVHLLLAVRTRLLLADDAPAADAKLMECVVTRQLVRVLYNARLVLAHQQLVAAH